MTPFCSLNYASYIINIIFITIIIFKYHYAAITMYFMYINAQLALDYLTPGLLHVVRIFSFKLKVLISKMFPRFILYGYQLKLMCYSQIYVFMNLFILRLFIFYHLNISFNTLGDM